MSESLPAPERGHPTPPHPTPGIWKPNAAPSASHILSQTSFSSLTSCEAPPALSGFYGKGRALDLEQGPAGRPGLQPLLCEVTPVQNLGVPLCCPLPERAPFAELVSKPLWVSRRALKRRQGAPGNPPRPVSFSPDCGAFTEAENVAVGASLRTKWQAPSGSHQRGPGLWWGPQGPVGSDSQSCLRRSQLCGMLI